MSDLTELPSVYLRIVPALRELHWPREVLATCADCAMARKRPGQIVFTAKARCCTYQPTVPNFLVGRILNRGDLGTEKMLARLADLEGVGPKGVRGPKALRDRYDKNVGLAFGRDDALTCPYWAEGALGCTIHRDRNAICRTWFCKTVQGRRGNRAWMALKDLLRCVEQILVEECIAEGAPPEAGADRQSWIDWYRWCAARVEQMSDAEIGALRGGRLAQLVDAVKVAAEARDASLPDVVMPQVKSWQGDEDGITMVAWANTDPARLPAWIFVLFSHFDGKRPWWEARRAAEEELDEVIPDDLIVALWRRGLLDTVPDGGPPWESPELESDEGA